MLNTYNFACDDVDECHPHHSPSEFSVERWVKELDGFRLIILQSVFLFLSNIYFLHIKGLFLYNLMCVVNANVVCVLCIVDGGDGGGTQY